MVTKYSITLISALSLFLLHINSARATLYLELSTPDNGSSITQEITDNLIGDGNSTTGILTNSTSLFGNWTVIVSTGSANPFIGDDLTSSLDLVSVAVSGGAGDLTIALTNTGYDQPGTGGVAAYNVQAVGTTDGSVMFNSYLDIADAKYGTGDSLFDSGILTGGSFGEFNAAEVGSVMTADIFSLTSIATISHTSSGDLTSFDFQLDVVGNTVPEPATLALMSLGLAGLGVARRRKDS